MPWHILNIDRNSIIDNTAIMWYSYIMNEKIKCCGTCALQFLVDEQKSIGMCRWEPSSTILLPLSFSIDATKESDRDCPCWTSKDNIDETRNNA